MLSSYLNHMFQMSMLNTAFLGGIKFVAGFLFDACNLNSWTSFYTEIVGEGSKMKNKLQNIVKVQEKFSEISRAVMCSTLVRRIRSQSLGAWPQAIQCQWGSISSGSWQKGFLAVRSMLSSKAVSGCSANFGSRRNGWILSEDWRQWGKIWLKTSWKLRIQTESVIWIVIVFYNNINCFCQSYERKIGVCTLSCPSYLMLIKRITPVWLKCQIIEDASFNAV